MSLLNKIGKYASKLLAFIGYRLFEIKKIFRELTANIRLFFLIIPRISRYLVLKDNIIVVYTVGKVGTTSIHRNIKEFAPFLHVFEVHFLTDVGVSGAEMSSGTPLVRYKANFIKKAIRLNPHKKVKIITAVRDPVERDISDFFENFKRDFKNTNLQDESTENLLKYFEKYGPDYSLGWLDREMKAYFDIDVYATPFDFDKKFQIIEKGRHQLLVLRLEDYDAVLDEALFQHLGIKLPPLKKYNEGEKKEYSMAFKTFKERVKLSPEKISKIYSSKFVQHFYRKEEIDGFIKKWSS